MHCSLAPTSPQVQGSQYPNPQWISTCHWIILFAHPQCSHTWHTYRESFYYTQSHWPRTSWNKLFMSMDAFFKCCVTLAHAHGTPAKLTVWILSPPLAAAFGQIVPMPSTIAHTSHNCGIPCNHIILCMDVLWNTLEACPINPCLANISSSKLLCTYTSDSQPPSTICKRNTCMGKTIHLKHDNKT